MEKKLKPRKKMIESEYKRFLWDCLIQSSAGRVSRMQGIKWMSRHFAENWRWHSSLDRVGMGWEFQQITELWIRVVYLRAKCQKRLSVIYRKKQRRIKKTSKTYMWQFVNRRAHQRWNIALHATTKRTSASKSLKFTYSSQHMKHKIVPSSLLLKLLCNLPYQHNVSTSMGQNLSPTFSVPPWLYSIKSNRIRCFLYFSVSSGYKSRGLTRVLWCERWHNYRYVTRKSGDWGYRSPNVKLVKQAICHSQSAN